MVVGGSPTARPISRQAMATRVTESSMRRTCLPWSRKYSAMAVATKAPRARTNADWSPYQGWNLAGFARTTLSRGKVVVDDYKFCGENGWGKFQKRKSPGKR